MPSPHAAHPEPPRKRRRPAHCGPYGFGSFSKEDLADKAEELNIHVRCTAGMARKITRGDIIGALMGYMREKGIEELEI